MKYLDALLNSGSDQPDPDKAAGDQPPKTTKPGCGDPGSRSEGPLGGFVSKSDRDSLENDAWQALGERILEYLRRIPRAVTLEEIRGEVPASLWVLQRVLSKLIRERRIHWLGKGILTKPFRYAVFPPLPSWRREGDKLVARLKGQVVEVHDLEERPPDGVAAKKGLRDQPTKLTKPGAGDSAEGFVGSVGSSQEESGARAGQAGDAAATEGGTA